ncbi:MAG: CocE/NonD family hydrolase [Actinocatenispora sp.]
MDVTKGDGAGPDAVRPPTGVAPAADGTDRDQRPAITQRRLRLGVAGRLIDRWLGLPPARTREVWLARDLAVPMSDGVVLLADRHRPAAGTGPMPVILIRSPYGRVPPYTSLFVGPFVRRGFQVVIQSVRGTFGSGGQFHPFRNETSDGLDTAAWLRAQPWCDGRIAMAGVSYLGYAQWALAPYLEPPLTVLGVALAGSRFDLGHLTGGSFPLHTALSWSALLGRQERSLLVGMLPNPLRTRQELRAMRRIPLRDAVVHAVGQPVQAWDDLINHEKSDDDYWAHTNHSPAVSAVTAPVSMVSAWYDPFLPQQLDDFRSLVDAGRPVRISIGPWGHGDALAARAAVVDQVEWLSRYLLDGNDRPVRHPVRVFLQRSGRWLRFRHWPPRSCRPTPIYLQPDGALDWRTPTDSEPDRFTYRPEDPTPAVGGPLITGANKQRINWALEGRPDVLVYTGQPLRDDLDLVGEVSAVIHLRADPAHADVFVRLCDVDRAGVSRNVCDGILRMRPGVPEPDPDGSVTATVSMWPTGYRFHRGHRLRIQVSGGAFPRFPRNHGTGAEVATAVRTRPARFAIRHDPSHPSRVILPVLPDL